MYTILGGLTLIFQPIRCSPSVLMGFDPCKQVLVVRATLGSVKISKHDKHETLSTVNTKKLGVIAIKTDDLPFGQLT